ncbi:MAG: hypothetical protein AM326_09840 [Candidatus Thorarchaeota archaeon SMTZ-45]|nr:MAG: hypothetical protein AM326_09840 [Candidatus Thorarchaeota archaeon SMTZ-45]
MEGSLKMNKVSIVIPARNEQYLQNTVNDLLNKSEGEIEIIVVLDGYWPDPPLETNEKVKIIHRSESLGMRNAINSGAAIAQERFLMKCDAHCCFDQGYDVKLINDCKEENWVLVPRRYSMNKKEWDRNTDKYFDFQYISHPDDPTYQFKGCNWPEFGPRVKGKKVADLMTSQGSCWFMHKSWFDFIEGEDEENYGVMGAEAQEICLKTWLSGGRFLLTKNTWYAHAKKRVSTYGYKKPMGEWAKSRAFAIDCWTNNKWHKQTKNFEWLVEHFRPVPGWHTDLESVKTIHFIRRNYRMEHATNKFPRVIPGLNRDGLIKLWKELGYKVGAEVGVEKGRFSKLILENMPELKMYLIDPYKYYDGARKKERGFSEHKRHAHNLLDQYNIIWLEKKSVDAVREIPDNSLDFVYIDGNHKYDYVMLDIILWTAKVRPGGMIAGHDYYNAPRSACMVQNAVDDYTKLHAIAPWYLTDKKAAHYRADKHVSWFWIKDGTIS